MNSAGVARRVQRMIGTDLQLSLAKGEDKSAVIANIPGIVNQWLARFEIALNSDVPDLAASFLDDSWLRDGLALSWDQRTLRGISAIEQYVQEHGRAHRRFDLKASDTPLPSLKEMGPMIWLESAFQFQTEVGQGRGLVRLANTAVGVWKAWVVSIRLEELSGFPQRHPNRPYYRHIPVPVADAPEESNEPTVVVIGAGWLALK